MTYNKPEIAVLGRAVSVIQSGYKTDIMFREPDGQPGWDAAYEPDE